MERRVVVYTPRGRDAEVVEGVLAGRGTRTLVCATPDEMLAGIREGAAAAVVTEESFLVGTGSQLELWLAGQPSWSDFPFIVLTTRDTPRRSTRAQASLQALGNVVLLERPVHAETLARAVDAAVRARNRQYETRQNLEELRQTRATVERLNLELEDRIASRTHALAAANDRLMAEIAERERVQTALVQMQKLEAIGRLTGGIAHDFNNLLHVVSMNLELLSRQSADAKLSENVERARRALRRGSRLTAQLLSFARVQSLLPRLTDLNALLLGMHELVAISVGSSVRLVLELCEDGAWVRLDPSQFEMAVLNLVVNARDAMPGGGTITIRTGKRDGSVEVSVTDRGVGIPEHLLSKVFDPFFTTKSVGSGTGLGLSQVYGFAQQSGGAASIDSRVGQGTTVELRFPAAPAEGTAPRPARLQAEHAATDLSILVVEDDVEVRRVIVESLSLNGHRVTAASDGLAGLEVLQRESPDLLIVDYAMPHMNGAAVIERAQSLRPGLPIILATGYADMAEVGRVLGTQSILVKPFDIPTLLNAVDAALCGRLRDEPVA